MTTNSQYFSTESTKRHGGRLRFALLAAVAKPYRTLTRWWQRLVDRVDLRLRPIWKPDTESDARRQQVSVFVALMIATWLMAAVQTAIHFGSKMPRIGLMYAIPLVWTTFAVLAVRRKSESYNRVVCVTTVLMTIHPWFVSFAGGGQQSGLVPMTWSLLGPVSAVLFLGMRAAVFNALLMVGLAAMLAVSELDALTPAVALSPMVRQTNALLSTIVPSLLVVVSCLLLFKRLTGALELADTLLLSVLPEPIARRLKREQTIIAEGHPDVSIIFADFVDFTEESADADPCQVVGFLNEIFSELDTLAAEHGLEKIKTIGDNYMAAGGLPNSMPEPCGRALEFAYDLLALVARRNAWHGRPLTVRIGIHCGPVVAGVIGQQKVFYDVWGDTVNTAGRMESYGVPGRIHVTEEVRNRLAGAYDFESRGAISIKGKGSMVTYLAAPRTPSCPAGPDSAKDAGALGQVLAAACTYGRYQVDKVRQS